MRDAAGTIFRRRPSGHHLDATRCAQLPESHEDTANGGNGSRSRWRREDIGVEEAAAAEKDGRLGNLTIFRVCSYIRTFYLTGRLTQAGPDTGAAQKFK